MSGGKEKKERRGTPALLFAEVSNTGDGRCPEGLGWEKYFYTCQAAKARPFAHGLLGAQSAATCESSRQELADCTIYYLLFVFIFWHIF